MGIMVRERSNQTPQQWKTETLKRLSTPNVSLRNYGGQPLNIIAQTTLRLSHGDHSINTTVLIQKGAPNQLLIGTDVLSDLGFSLRTGTERAVDLLAHKRPNNQLPAREALSSAGGPPTRQQDYKVPEEKTELTLHHRTSEPTDCRESQERTRQRDCRTPVGTDLSDAKRYQDRTSEQNCPRDTQELTRQRDCQVSEQTIHRKYQELIRQQLVLELALPPQQPEFQPTDPGRDIETTEQADHRPVHSTGDPGLSATRLQTIRPSGLWERKVGANATDRPLIGG